MRAPWRQLIAEDSGISAIEVALIFPVMLFMLISAVDYFDYFNSVRRLAAAASATNELVARAGYYFDVTSLGNIVHAAAPAGLDYRSFDDYPVTTSNSLAGTGSDGSGSGAGGPQQGVTITIFYMTQGVAVQKWQYSQGIFCGVPTPVPNLASFSPDEADVILVSTCMNWKPLLFSIFGLTPRAISQFSISRPRDVQHLECNDC
jgi:Flp pilus assembly pilin Flp